MNSQSLDQSIEVLRNASMKHYAALLEGNHRVANRNAGVEENAFEAIKAFGVAGREALIRLIDDAEKPVALTAAAFSISYSPERCERVIRKIAKDRALVGFIAKQALKRWEEGNVDFG